MIPFPDKKYNLIVIDPPWPIKKSVRRVRPKQGECLDYKTMTIEEIIGLPIDSICDSNACCFLWTIQKYLPLSFSILDGFGFNYHKTITWDKSNGMTLFGFHGRTEFAVFGYKGKIDTFPRRKAMPTLISGKSKYHSAKPDEFYEYAELFGDRRIDVFARCKRDGWDVWGDEV